MSRRLIFAGAEARCLFWELFGTTEQAAEKLVSAHISMGARIAGAEARAHFKGVIGTTKVMPCYKARVD
jgi:hypothetical protein